MGVSNYIGKGIIFPFELTGGKIVLTENEALIEASIRTILSWPKYTKYFDLLFGSRLFQLPGEPNDFILRSLVYEYTKEALNIYEPRIELLESFLSYPNESSINLQLTYRIKSSMSIKTLSYPLTI